MSDLVESAVGGSAGTEVAPPGVAVLDAPANTLDVTTPVNAPRPNRRVRVRRRLRRFGWWLARPLAVLRYVFRKLLWVLVKLVQAGWRHPIVALLLVIAVGVGYQGYNDYIKDKPAPPPAEVFDIAAPIPPPAVAKQFLDAQQAFDGNAMWDMLPDEAKANMVTQGISKQTYAQGIENMQLNGAVFGDSAYVGGIKGADGVDRYFYTTQFAIAGNGSTIIYQVIYVDDTDGALLWTDNPLPDSLMSTASQ
jgi:hypothetical protein